jgi:hypothetical protein
MRISSRPGGAPVGTGTYRVNVGIEELRLIGALMYITRLGGGTYKEAAFRLLGTIEEFFGEDFVEQASTAVGLRVSVLAADGVTVKHVLHGGDVCLEV